MFKDLENTRPFLKMAFEGFAGDGKTFTASKVAIGIHKLINSKKPIALFDTERAFKALIDLFKIETGFTPLVVENQRSLAALSQAIKQCEEGLSDILIIDSVTHVWEEFLRAYLNRPDKYGKPTQRNRLEFQDWGVIKPQWKEQFANTFVMANLHIIFTGRAGYEYTNEQNEDGKREIFKSGIKMKAESETAFEPDILVLMERHEELLAKDKRVWRQATVIKDRTDQIDGKTFTNPGFDEFYPAIKVLLNGSIRDAHGNDIIPDTFAEFENKYSEAAKERGLSIAEIQGCIHLLGLGTGAQDQQFKAWILSQIFDVKAIESLEGKSNAYVKSRLPLMKEFTNKYKEYFNACLDNDKPVEKEKIRDIMKTLLNETLKV